MEVFLTAFGVWKMWLAMTGRKLYWSHRVDFDAGGIPRNPACLNAFTPAPGQDTTQDLMRKSLGAINWPSWFIFK